MVRKGFLEGRMPQAGSKAYLEWATSWIIRKQRLWMEGGGWKLTLSGLLNLLTNKLKYVVNN